MEENIRNVSTRNENVADRKMQTQVQLRSKKNKAIVPFYSPPCRLYGQTSADIIKEARAAVMTTSPVGIKPVFTSRPFTPNQKERTLFGDIKKSKSRPPSSFSLRNLKSQEPNSRVKLPSIEIASRRNNYSTSQNSKNLSLDDLTEDYDAEIFEQTKFSDAENLPTWKKPHSCPKEGRLSKVASLNDIHHSFLVAKNCEKENLKFQAVENDDRNLDDYSSNERKLFGDSVKLEQNETRHENLRQNPIMTKGGGDYEVFLNKELLINNKNLGSEAEASLLIDASELKGSQSEDETTDAKEKISQVNASKGDEGEESREKLENSKEKIIETKKEQNYSKENKEFCKNENVAEKSIATGPQSEYLMSLKSGFKSTIAIKQPHTVPLEIIELYETARYYAMDVGQNDKETSATVATSTKSVGRKSNNNFKIGENLKTFIEIQKNEAVEKLPRSQNAVSTKNQMEIAPKGNSDEYVEFVMNNKKRYHTVGGKGNIKEKAYKKWSNKLETNIISSKTDMSNDGWDLFWKNSYYKDKDKKEKSNKKDDDPESLQSLINRISGLVKKGADDREIYQSISQLYGLIKNNKLILDSMLKEGVTRVLYLYIDSENAEVLLSLAKIFFIVKEENLLSVACKVIFKVARFDTNDHLFLNEEDVLELFLEGIGRASPLDCAESCIYGYGALKFLTLNHSILSRILHLGALDLMTLHLKMINNAYTENGFVGEQTQHALFQLTGGLRHIAAGEGALSLFLTTNCISILCDTLRYFYKDEDVTINICRTLSLLSTDEIVTQALMQVENILATLIDLIEQYKENDKILIRLAFCLGNIVEHSDLARVQVDFVFYCFTRGELFSAETTRRILLSLALQLSRNDAALSILLSVLKVYIDKDLEITLREENSQHSDALSLEAVDDVIVKVIRIIANMSMNPIVGSSLSPATKEKKSLELSKLLSLLLIRKDPGITLLATLGCLNNISYYCNTHSVLIDITQGVERVLGLESVECQIEAARVLGNLTRHKEIRDLIYSTGGVDLLIKLLSSPEQEVVRCACGALVNMMLDSKTRNFFAEAQGIDKLVKALEIFPGDWSLASLAARAIWNCCGDDMSSAMSHNNVEHLLNTLAGSLEEENWNDGDVAWEEFASVATDLLEKISFHLEST